MKTEYIERGFAYINFTDGYSKCSIQKSSSVDDAIWFGSDDLGLKHFIPYGQPESWRDVDVNELLGITPENGQNFVANTRMYLSRELVEELLPILQHFVDTGELPVLVEDESDDG